MDILQLMGDHPPDLRYAIPGWLLENEGIQIYGGDLEVRRAIASALIRALVEGSNLFGIPIPRRYRCGFLPAGELTPAIVGLQAAGLVDLIKSPGYALERGRSGHPWIPVSPSEEIKNLASLRSFLQEFRPEFLVMEAIAPRHTKKDGLNAMALEARRQGCGLIALSHKRSGYGQCYPTILELVATTGGGGHSLITRKHRHFGERPPLSIRRNYMCEWYGAGCFSVLSSGISDNQR